MSKNETNNSASQLKSILGEIPNYIFEHLELSDDIKNEWKLGSKASDFGGHNQFVQKFTKRMEKLLNDIDYNARIDERSKVDYELEVLQDLIDEDIAFTDEFKHGVRVARREVEENTKDLIKNKDDTPRS